MLKIWDYILKGKPNAYKKERQEKADKRLLLFASHDPELPWYGRDPKEIKRDTRYQQLSRKHKDIFNRLLDELWINKGFLPLEFDYIAHCLELENKEEANDFLDLCFSFSLIEVHNGCVYVPELREQYVRAIIKADTKVDSAVAKKPPEIIEDAF